MIYHQDPGFYLHSCLTKALQEKLSGNDKIGGAKIYQFASPNEFPSEVEIDFLSSVQVDVEKPNYDVSLIFRWRSHDRFEMVEGQLAGEFVEFDSEYQYQMELIHEAVTIALTEDFKHVDIVRIGQVSSGVDQQAVTRVDFETTIPFRCKWVD